MTFAELEAPAALFRELEETAFKMKSDAEAVALKKSVAKQDLLLHIGADLGIDTNSVEGVSAIDKLVDSNLLLFQRALVYRQLYWLFGQSGGDYNQHKQAEYSRLYLDVRRAFPSLQKSALQTFNTVTLYR
jgi:hypothetical protein